MLIAQVMLAHLVGDYLLQSHYMAVQKVNHWWPAIVHGITYTLPYLFITQSPWALLMIAGTHVVIDHYRLAKHLGWLKNQIGPKKYRPSWAEAKANGGYSASTPIWLATFLMIVSDNTVHILLGIGAILLWG